MIEWDDWGTILSFKSLILIGHFEFKLLGDGERRRKWNPIRSLNWWVGGECDTWRKNESWWGSTTCLIAA